MGPRKGVEFSGDDALNRQLKLFEVDLEYLDELPTPGFPDAKADLYVFRHNYSTTPDGGQIKGVGAFRMEFSQHDPSFFLHAHPLSEQVAQTDDTSVRVDLDVFSFWPIGGMISRTGPQTSIKREDLRGVFSESTIDDILSGFAFRDEGEGLFFIDNLHIPVIVLGSSLQSAWQVSLSNRPIRESEAILRKVEAILERLPDEPYGLYGDIWDVIGAAALFKKFYKRSENHEVWKAVSHLLEKVQSKKKLVKSIAAGMKVDPELARTYVDHDVERANQVKQSYRKKNKNK